MVVFDVDGVCVIVIGKLNIIFGIVIVCGDFCILLEE